MIAKMHLARIRTGVPPYLFLLPVFVLLFVFKILPIFYSAWLSFSDYSVIAPWTSSFIGLENFRRLFVDPYILNGLKNSFIFALGSLVPGLLLSLLLSLVLSEKWVVGVKTTRTILFIPYVLSITIAGLIWLYMFNPTFGLANYILGFLGLPEQKFLGDPTQAMAIVCAMSVWKNMGYNVTIWTAGLISIPLEYRDAAKIDGANYLKEFIYIRLPLLKPIAKFLTVLGFIGALQSFDAIYVMTAGGPMRKTEVIVYYLWNQAFKQRNVGYASAMSWLLFVILLAFTYVQFKMYGQEKDVA